MAENIEVIVESDISGIKILGKGGRASADHLLREALEDIADKIEDEARLFAPHGETGELKEHPTDRKDVFGEAVGGAPLFGGGFAVRPKGARGFIPGKSTSPTGKVAHILITVAKIPKHAVWVHEGTGIFGEHETPIVPRHATYMRFLGHSGWVRAKSVRGQPPQPFLTKAYRVADATYVPERVERLRLEIDALFS